MSSLRLALKQSLKEAVGVSPGGPLLRNDSDDSNANHSHSRKHARSTAAGDDDRRAEDGHHHHPFTTHDDEEEDETTTTSTPTGQSQPPFQSNYCHPPLSSSHDGRRQSAGIGRGSADDEDQHHNQRSRPQKKRKKSLMESTGGVDHVGGEIKNKLVSPRTKKATLQSRGSLEGHHESVTTPAAAITGEVNTATAATTNTTTTTSSSHLTKQPKRGRTPRKTNHTSHDREEESESSSENEFSVALEDGELDDDDERGNDDDDGRGRVLDHAGTPSRERHAANKIQHHWKQRSNKSTTAPMTIPETESTATVSILKGSDGTGNIMDSGSKRSRTPPPSSRLHPNTAPSGKTTAPQEESMSLSQPASPAGGKNQNSNKSTNASNEVASAANGTKQKTNKPKTVPPPSHQVMEHQAQLDVKRARNALAVGLRVKVRFALQKEGKRKKKWFGGRISAVSKEGSKMRIKYDDGTSEVAKFPDGDIVIDDAFNGEHEASANFFLSPHQTNSSSLVASTSNIVPPTDTVTATATGGDHVTNTISSEKRIGIGETQAVSKTPREPTEDPIHLTSVFKEELSPASFEMDEPTESFEAGDSSSDPPKRKRGRPKKSPLDDIVSSPNPTSSTPQAADITESGGSSNSTNTGGDIPPPKMSTCHDDTSAESHDGLARSLQQDKPLPQQQPPQPTPAPGPPVQQQSQPKSLTIRIPVVKERKVELKAKRVASQDNQPDETAQPKRIHLRMSKEGGPTSPTASPRHKKKKRKLLEDDANGVLTMPVLGGEHSAFQTIPSGVTGATTTIPTDVFHDVSSPRVGKAKAGDSAQIVRSGRRAAQQANQRIKQQDPSPDPLKLKLKKKKRKDEEFPELPQQPPQQQQQQENISEDDSQWVQCDRCGKWRVIPSSVVASLPKQWFCEYNTYDPKRASCDAPEQTAKQAAKERKRKKRQERMLLEQGTAEVGMVAKSIEPTKEKSERARSPRPPVDPVGVVVNKGRRASPESMGDACGGGDTRPEKKLPVAPTKKQRSEAVVVAAAAAQCTNPESGTPAAEVRRGRGRPPRNRGQKESNVTSIPSDEADNVEWVQCEKCNKWRKLPPHISADELPEVWFCSMNTWNATLTCEDPEDKADGLQDLAIFGGNGSSSKLSYRNLIFGNTGRKANRPVSERTRAAESLFGTITDDEDSPPAVMYSNCCAFVSRSKNHNAEEEKGPTFFETMSQSNLWSELWASQPLVGASGGNGALAGTTLLSAYTYETLPPTMQQPLKDLLLDVLGLNTYTGEEILTEITNGNRDYLSEDCVKARAYCTINVIVTALADLVREGLVEVVRPKDAEWTVTNWTPRYRIARNPCKSVKQAALEREKSRCMKIAKPWKRLSVGQ